MISVAALGFNTPGNFAQGLNWAKKLAIGYEVASTGYGAYDSTRNIIEGCATPWDALSFDPLAGYGLSKLKGLGNVKNAKGLNGLDEGRRELNNTAEAFGNAAEELGNAANDINHTMFQPDLTPGDTLASEELLDSMRQQGKEIIVAKPGSDEERLLNYFNANASVNTENMNNILVRPDVRKIEILEEFLHETQNKLGIIEKRGHHGAEIHVKDFMIRHQKMLGLSNNIDYGCKTSTRSSCNIHERCSRFDFRICQNT